MYVYLQNIQQDCCTQTLKAKNALIMKDIQDAVSMHPVYSLHFSGCRCFAEEY